MSVDRVASAYAKSIMDLSIEQNSLELVCQDFKLAMSIFDKSYEFKNLVASPIVSSSKKLSIFNEIFINKISPLSLNFFKLVIKKKRENILHDVLKSFISQYKLSKGIYEATLITSQPVNESIQWQVIDVLRKISDKNYELSYKIDTSIIGGFILKTGDKQIDASVKTQLNIIKNQFSK